MATHPSGRVLLARAFDSVAEATVVPSFSRAGISLRRQLESWVDPPSMAGKVAVVTGSTSGIGLAAAIGLAKLGAQVHLVGRNPERAERARAQVERAGPGPVGLDLVDLSDPDAVGALGERLAERYDHIHALVHNAGALSRTYTTSPGGVEVTVATQLLGPYVLTAKVAPLLSGPEGATIVTVSSGGMYTQRFDLAELEMGAADYDGVVAYARVKRAQLLLAEDWAHHLGPGGTSSFSMHPGWVDTPGLKSGLPRFRVLWRPVLRTAAEGADTVVWLAAGGPADQAHHDGESVPTSGFFHDRHQRRDYRFPVTHPSAPGDAEALWRWLGERTGIDTPATMTLPGGTVDPGETVEPGETVDPGDTASPEPPDLDGGHR